MSFLNLMPWWAWLLCGAGSFLVASLVGRRADDYGSTTAEIIRMIAGFAGVIGIAIGMYLFVH